MPDMSEFRKLFLKIDKDETICRKLILITRNHLANPVAEAYHAAALMTSAKYAFWPLEKLKRFNEGKTILEKAVEADPLNPEIRWLRYLIQKNSPDFLQYNHHLSDDMQFLKNLISSGSFSDKELFSYIKSSLENEGR